MELIDITGFSDKSENDGGGCFPTFYEMVIIKSYTTLKDEGVNEWDT